MSHATGTDLSQPGLFTLPVASATFLPHASVEEERGAGGGVERQTSGRRKRVGLWREEGVVHVQI